MRNFKIGFSLGPLLSIKEIILIARYADEAGGVDSIWIPESWGRESFSTLGAISQVTRKLRLGSSIINVYSRSPATIAMGAATLDKLSNNRTIIGLGTSTPELVTGWHGMEFDSPLQRVKECIECLRLILSGERVKYNGRHFKINNFKILETPTRKTLPIFVAAVHQKMIDLARSYANGVVFYLRPIDELRKTVSTLRSGVRINSCGADFEIACSIICAISSSNPQKARERASKTLAYYISTGRYYNRFLADNGFRNDVISIAQRYKNVGLEAAAEAITDKMLDSLTICGSIEQCSKSFERFLSSGISLPIIQVNPVDDSVLSFKEMLSAFKCTES